MGNTDTKNLGDPFVGVALYNIAQFFYAFFIQKMQSLALSAHARPVFIDKASFERNVARPVVKKLFHCRWSGFHLK
jgi:hypothetical protein